MQHAGHANRWFTQPNMERAAHAIATDWLTEEAIRVWLAPYAGRSRPAGDLGIVCAGNIPFVGLHDILCAYVAGIPTQIKTSAKDEHLITWAVERLRDLSPDWPVRLVDRLESPDRVIATGSDNTNRYFEHYFRRMPSLLRRNRTSLAILDGSESDDELRLLMDDVLSFFGLGCRNVSQILVPDGFDLDRLANATNDFTSFRQHALFMDNYDYRRTLLLMNGVEHLATDVLLFVPDDRLHAALATVHVRRHDTPDEVDDVLIDHRGDLQTVVGRAEGRWTATPFGQAQRPALSDYADGEDTLDFLLGPPLH